MILYRGLRGDSEANGNWHTPEKEYALQYGNELLSRDFDPSCEILDLTQAINQDGYISGESLESLCSGLASLHRLDADEEVLANELWNYQPSAKKIEQFLVANGFQAMKQIENDFNVAYFLIG